MMINIQHNISSLKYMIAKWIQNPMEKDQRNSVFIKFKINNTR